MRQQALLLPARRAALLVGLVACGAYLNTLVGDFTFDDNFAIISNGDVTNDANPLLGLLKHDFWGQDIVSHQSHKSYRPVTVLAFRLTRQAWDRLAAVVPGLEALLPSPPASTQQQDAYHTKPARPPGLHPFPFHVLCVAMHSLVSVLVLALAQHLFARLEQLATPQRSSEDVPPAVGQQPQASPPAGGLLERLLMWHAQPPLWLTPHSRKYQAQALLAALFFALHPVHTEAVAGIVGCAELICAAWSLPALLLYCMAVDGRYAAAAARHKQLLASSCQAAAGGARSAAAARSGGGRLPARSPGGGGQPKQGAAAPAPPAPAPPSERWLAAADALQHWGLVLAACCLAWLAALSKEIGITLVGTMALYDLLLPPGGGLGLAPDASPAAARRQLLRLVLLAVTGLGYVKLRSWVAVQQLVAIYRKVENPIPFEASRLARALTTGHLHARYAWLLLAPLHLSADWSFNCIPLVQHAADPRNLATLALYACLAVAVLAARPLALAQQLCGVLRCATQAAPAPGTAPPPAAAGAPAPGGGAAAGPHAPGAVARHRWRLLVVAGLLVAPFFPASNVLFYVGTFIGERLLYAPSIGFCLLAAELLGAGLPETWQQQEGQQEQLGQGQQKQQQEQQRSGTGRGSAVRAALALALSAALLAGYAGRTLLRNVDWWDEERLFLAALRVCPDSAKVQQNCGVLQRRYQNYGAALEHFKRAQEIEPGYCEPSYWIALTTLNTGEPLAGLAGMKASLRCKYTAGEALTTLNKLYVVMHESGGQDDPGPMVEWAEVLALPSVLRVQDACATAEDAALLAALSGRKPAYIGRVLDVCLQGISHWQSGDTESDTLAGLAKERYAGLNATLLQACVELRAPVYSKLAGRSPSSKAVRRALYRYLAKVSDTQPACRTSGGGGNAPVDADPQAAPPPSTHQKLLHKFQATDPEDPWLQLEWGTTLLALSPRGQLKEAAAHLEVASAIFGRVHEEAVLAGGGAAAKPGSGLDGRFLERVTALDGRSRLTPQTALEAAMLPLERFKAAAVAVPAASDPGLGGLLCEMLKRLCHLRLQAVVVAQQQQQAAAGGPSSAGGLAATKALVNAKAAGRRCLLDLSDRRGCARQLEEIQRLVGKQQAPRV